MRTLGEGKDMPVDKKGIYTEKTRKVEVKKHGDSLYDQRKGHFVIQGGFYFIISIT